MKSILIVFILSAFTFIHAQAPRYTMKEVKRVYNSEKYNRDSAYVISISYPIFDENGQNSFLAKKLNKEVLSQMPIDSGTVEDAADGMIEFYQQYESEDDFGVYWSFEMNVSVKETGGKIISLLTGAYDYSGGAHGNGFVSFSNYAMEGGRKLALSDIVDEEGKKTLTRVAEEVFRKDKDLVGKDLTEEGYWFGEEGFFLNDNFLLDETSITFFYNSYEIAPYAAGPSEIIIQYDQFKAAIKKDGPLSFLFE